jgi:hypothetical protein
MNVLIDISSNRLTFLDNRFYMHEDGNYYPSVTTILDAYPKGPEYYAWLKKTGEDSDAVRDEAGRRGSIVHQLTELFDSGEEVTLMNEQGYISYKMVEWAMFERYIEFRRRFPLEIIHTELNLVSPELGFAGTLDRVIEMNGRRILLDIKTSNSIYPSYWLQLAAYKELYGEPIDEVGILWLNAKTRTEGSKGAVQGAGWQLITKQDTSKDWEMFQCTHKLWLAENEGMKPKQTSYSLSHKL